MNKNIFLNLLIVLLMCFSGKSNGQDLVQIIINADSVKNHVSPYIYGKNNCLSDNPGSPLADSDWQRLIDAGINMFRENGGNNATKYNWRRKLSSHPDWYNNVYAHDWDYAAKRLQQHIPGTQGMWAFQLIGKAAKTNAYNFPDWNYNQAQWWEGVAQNLCGGGQVNRTGGTKALVEGNTNLYLENWPADSTVGILDHWFGPGGVGLDSTFIRYWSMDNEPEIWNGTHDDVMPVQPDAETFMQLYFNVAKKARAVYPGIKLVGPVPANEWQWYNYNGAKISYKNQEYTWLEFFILRVAEEQQRTGIRLLDVLDIHFYPGESTPADIVQLHRVYFDKTYNYPGANGVKKSGPGGWDATITKEYIFARCAEWLEKYMGPNHGVTFSVTETGINGDNPNVTALWYASTLGEFAKQGVEIFTPWTWKTGMYEVLHLFSRFGQKNFVKSSSSLEEFVSVYPMVNDAVDSMTIFLVNRSVDQPKNLNVDLNGFHVKNGKYKGYMLSQLPQSETFISHSRNALKETETEVAFNKLNITLAPLSILAVQLVSSKEETRKATFRIFGRTGINVAPLNQAGIKIDSFSAFTNTDGLATIDLTTGMHDITFSKNGYASKYYQLNIASDTFMTDTLQVKTFNVLFVVKDKETGQLLNNCRVTTNNQSKITDINGRVEFTGVPPSFNVGLGKTHFRDTLISNIEINSDTSLILFIETIKYHLTFHILDSNTGRGIWGSVATIGLSVQTSDYSGDVLFDLSFGNYSFTIENPSYKTVSDSLYIESDSSLVFRLSPTSAFVKFRLKTGDTPVDDAEIKVGESILKTNLLGMATFYNLPTEKAYNYSINKTGYENISSSIYLRKDTTIDVNMVETDSPYIGNPDKQDFKIWPNPASTNFFLNVFPTRSNSMAIIKDITGRTIKTIPIQSQTIKIGINEIPDGIYILQVQTKDSKYSKYFIKNNTK